jgi:UDP-4-amino-4-deoxy-L-arabinose formyltransferase/UDP-glucuronic acid dehydrogenase (UDP-4-keto-hexauronic acid decarboxylating)
MNNLKIFVLSTIDAGVDIINILKQQLKISGVVGLADQKNTHQISGYFHLGDYCKKNSIPFHEVKNYSMKDEEDKILLESLNIDVLIVAGWQRLIPKWLINHCRISVIGAHGSPYGIAGGRGRSPQNWSILMGKKEFYISIFKIDEGIDSGDIIEERKYEISVWDDIRSSYNKVVWLTGQMIIDAILSKRIETNRLIPQDLKPRYFPQRTREDGEIDWNRTNEEVHNFIRALTHPYPGAYSKIGGKEIIIWCVKPFDVFTVKNYEPGTIVKVYNYGAFMVSTARGFIQVDNYTVKDNIDFKFEEGMVFSSVKFIDQMKNIIERHIQKYPSLTLAEDLLNLSK